MTMMEAGVIIWLTDLVVSNPHQVRLSEKVHEQWDLAIAQDKTFGIMDCITIGLTHWSKVRETQATISGKQPGSGGPPNGNDVVDPTMPRQKKEEEKEQKEKRGKTRGWSSCCCHHWQNLGKTARSHHTHTCCSWGAETSYPPVLF